jgi:hypothetical protein
MPRNARQEEKKNLLVLQAEEVEQAQNAGLDVERAMEVILLLREGTARVSELMLSSPKKRRWACSTLAQVWNTNVNAVVFSATCLDT